MRNIQEILWLIIIVSSITLFQTCKKAENPVEPIQTPDVVLADNIVQADSNNFKAMLVSLDSNQVIFNSSSSLAQNLKVGEILISDYGEGVLRKVLSKSSTNNVITITTRQAALDEVILKGRIEWDGTISPENVSLSYDSDKATLTKTNDNIAISFLGVGIGAGEDVKLDITTSFDPPVTKGLILIDNGLFVEVSIKIICHTNITTKALRRAFIQGQITPDWATIKFPGIPIPGLPLIKLVPKIKFGLGCNAAVEDAMTNEINGVLEFTGGFKYEDGQGSLIKSLNKSFTSGQLTRSTGELTGYLIAPRFGLYIAGAVGPYVDLQFYGKFKEGLENGNPFYGRYAGIRSTAGIEAQILSWSVSYSGVLFDFEEELEKVYLINQSPNASFTVAPINGNINTIFEFNASDCSDPEDPSSVLQVRWDWEGDGIWDTQYSTSKTTTHNYVQPGTYIVKMQVKDTGGLTDEISTQIIVTELGNILVTNPASLTKWILGQQNVPIQWETASLSGDVKIELYKGTTISKTIIASTPNDGNYTYNVPTDLTPGSDYRVKVTSLSVTSKEDYSDYYEIKTSTIAPGSVAHYKFEGNANDISGNNYNGTVNSVPRANDRFGNTGGAYKFDGNTDHFISLPDLGLGNGSNEKSFCSFFKLNAENTTSWLTIIGQWLGLNQRWHLTIRTSEIVFYEMDGSDNQPYTIPVNIDTTDFHFITAICSDTYPTGQKIKIYLDTEYLGSISSYNLRAFSGIYNVGRSGQNTYDKNYGTIDDLRIYNYALTEQEMISIYHENGWPIGSGGITMGYWKLDESSGNIVNDASSNNNTGTANSSSAIVTGIYGNARKVVQLGYTTSISIPNSTSLNLSGVKPFTIECLVKVSAHAYYGDIFIEKKGSYGLATGSYGSSGYLQLFIWPNITNPYVLQSNEKIPVNEWVHLAGTWDGSKAKIYINYQLVKEQSYTIAMSGSTDNLTLGRTGQSHTSESIIDEIRLTNKILIPSEFIQKP